MKILAALLFSFTSLGAAHAGSRAEITVSRTGSGPNGYNKVHEEHSGRRQHHITCTGAGLETGDFMHPPKVNGDTAHFFAIDREVKSRIAKLQPGTRGSFEWPGNVVVRYAIRQTGYTYTIEDR